MIGRYSKLPLGNVNNGLLVGQVGGGATDEPVGDQCFWLASQDARVLNDQQVLLVVSVASLGGWAPRFCCVEEFQRRPMVVWVGIQATAGHKAVESSPWVIPLRVVHVVAAFADS